MEHCIILQTLLPKEGVDSALGYSLVDARTGKLYYYNGKEVKGIMDGSAATEVVDNSFKREMAWDNACHL